MGLSELHVKVHRLPENLTAALGSRVARRLLGLDKFIVLVTVVTNENSLQVNMKIALTIPKSKILTPVHSLKAFQHHDHLTFEQKLEKSFSQSCSHGHRQRNNFDFAHTEP